MGRLQITGIYNGGDQQGRIDDLITALNNGECFLQDVTAEGERLTVMMVEGRAIQLLDEDVQVLKEMELVWETIQ